MDADMRYCVKCKSFLEQSKFVMAKNRNTCREHINKQHAQYQIERWKKHPMERKAHTIWQIAYLDCRKTFQIKMKLGLKQVLKLLESKEFGLENDVRFVPLDPLEPLSISNFCMTNAATRFDLCFMWRRVHCAEDYKACFEPKCNPTIYVSSRLAVGL